MCHVWLQVTRYTYTAHTIDQFKAVYDFVTVSLDNQTIICHSLVWSSVLYTVTVLSFIHEYTTPSYVYVVLYKEDSNLIKEITTEETLNRT